AAMASSVAWSESLGREGAGEEWSEFLRCGGSTIAGGIALDRSPSERASAPGPGWAAAAGLTFASVAARSPLASPRLDD
ncbi:MAG: hypothetical protein ACXWNX_11735, partial [Isosphaeraceae bacterium]